MLRAPIWITSATSSTGSRSRASITSVTIGRPVCALAQALEGRGGGAGLGGAAAKHHPPRPPRPAGVTDDPRGLERLLAALDRARSRDDRKMRAAHLAPADVQHRALAVL